MIDFARLVIRPALNLFGQTVEYRPLASRPGHLPHSVRAIFDNEHQAVEVAEGFISTGNPQIGVLLSDFEVEPVAGDHVMIGTYVANRTKVAADAWALGTTLYLNGRGEATSTPGVQNPLLGVAASAALPGSTTAPVSIERLYYVLEVKPDGTGHAKLMLREVE